MGNRMGVTVGSAWTAVVAGLGWLVSGALYGVLTWFGFGIPATVVRLVTPETVAGTAWHSVMPWPVVVPALSALVLMGLTAFLAQFVLPRSAPEAERPLPTFLAVWFCVVLASFATGVLWSGGTVLANWPPARLAMLFSDVESDLLSAGYWGIAWGWIPALAGLLAARRQRTAHTAGTARTAPPRASSIRIGMTVVVAVLLVASAPLAAAANRAARTPEAVPAPAPSQPQVVYGSPETAAAHQAPGPDWCPSGQVSITPGQTDAAAGHRGLDIRLVNTGAAPCVLNSYPDVTFDDSAGWAMEVLLVRGGSFMTTDPGVHAITLAPGASAHASLGWNAMAAAGVTRAGTLLVAPYAGAVRQSSPADLDIVNGGAVSVTAWQLG